MVNKQLISATWWGLQCLQNNIKNMAQNNIDRASRVVQSVKNPPAMQETLARSLGCEDPLHGMATHSGILAWRIPWAEKPGGL